MIGDIYASRGMGELPAPPGTELPPGYPPLDVATQLKLPAAGLYTPWAARDGKTDWQQVQQPPSTNVAAFQVNDAAIQAASLIAAGQQLPFVVVLTKDAKSPTEITTAASGSPYDFYETQAVYSQDDKAQEPTPVYMHWLQLRSPNDSSGGSAPMQAVASRLGGTLLYAFPVDYGSTARRAPPSLPFTTVFDSPAAAPQSSPPFSPPPAPSGPAQATSRSGSMGLAIAFGSIAAAVSFYAVREARSRSRR